SDSRGDLRLKESRLTFSVSGISINGLKKRNVSRCPPHAVVRRSRSCSGVRLYPAEVSSFSVLVHRTRGQSRFYAFLQARSIHEIDGKTARFFRWLSNRKSQNRAPFL